MHLKMKRVVAFKNYTLFKKNCHMERETNFDDRMETNKQKNTRPT